MLPHGKPQAGHYAQAWRQPQNRKYTTYRNALVGYFRSDFFELDFLESAYGTFNS